MKNLTYTIFVGTLMSLILFSPFSIRTVAAQTATQGYTPLAPIAGLNDTKNGQTDVSTFIPTAVRYVIEIAGALAVIMIVIGGVQYASSDAITGKSEGKSKITNAIYGLILIFAAFVILQTINPNILKLNLSLSLPSSGSTQSTGVPGCPGGTIINGACVVTGLSGPTNLGTTAGSAWPPASLSQTTSVSDGTSRTDLGKLVPPVTVKVNPATNQPEPNCSSVGQTGCISLDGLSTGALNGLAALSADAQSGGAIVITGGTEYWEHCVDPATGKSFTPPCDDPTTTSTDHKPGTGAVDISSNSTALDGVISSKGTQTSSTGNGCESTSLKVYSLSGGTYVQEADNSKLGYHWHVCYGP